MAILNTATSTESLTAISAALTHKFKPGFVEVFNQENDLWNLIPKVKATGEAARAKFHVQRNGSAERNTETGTIGTPGNQLYQSGYMDYVSYDIPIGVTDLMVAKSFAAGHSGYEAWGDEVVRGAEDLKRLVNEDLWGLASDNSNACAGIQDALDRNGTPDSYWGLSRAAYAFLKCIYVDHTSGGENQTLTFAVLRQLWRQMRHGTGSAISGTSYSFAANDQGGGQANVWFTTPEIESAYEALVTANNRYPIPPAQTMGVDPGQTGLFYKKAPVVGSRFCPDYNWFGLDLSTWSIEILPQVFVLPDGRHYETDFALIVEGRSDQAVEAFWRIYFQLICDKPWRNGRIYGISHTEPS